MEKLETGSHPSRSILSQSENNTTVWIGHLQNDPVDHIGGQTFVCPADGQLDNIQLFTSAVQCPGRVELTIHEFDPETRHWGPALGNSILDIQLSDQHTWIRFDLPVLSLNRNKAYGFRVQSPDAMVGLGEAATDNQHPFPFGHEWNSDSLQHRGHYYSYFSLAFKVQMRA